MIDYRTPSENDLSALSELGSSSFSDTFGHLYSAENLALFLAQTHGEAMVLAELRNPMRQYLVAHDAGKMVAYCKLGFDHSLPLDLPGRAVMELKQLYLRPSHFATGVAEHLMDWAIAAARSRAIDDIVLSVYSDNPRAQRFYQRYGFAHAKNCFFMVGEHRDDEYLYRLILRP
jgi:diamine N-acetyltransferase